MIGVSPFQGPHCPVRAGYDIARPFGDNLCAVLTRKSFDDMDLNIGKSVWITFKANAVRIL